MFPATRVHRGVAVAVVMLLVFLVIAMTTASGLLTSQNYTTGSFREKTMHADLAVKAGIATAMDRLTQDPSWSPTEASPYREYLDPESNIGFEVWLDANNETGTVPVATSEGFDLQPGQVSLRVRALVNGDFVSGGYGGADQLIVLERPPVEFEHALFRVTPGELDFVSSNGHILSYDSSNGIMPFQGFPAAPPPENQRASLRSLGDIYLNGVTVHGDAILPTFSNIGTFSGASVLATTRLDEGYLPRLFESRGRLPGAAPAAGVIPPGEYDRLNIPNGATVSLQRGGVYYFSDFVGVGDNATVTLSGPVSDGPVEFYCHSMIVGKNCRINIPPPGVAPQPEELQFYGIPQPGCGSVLLKFGDDTEAAMVVASQIMGVETGNNNVLYGAFNADYFKARDNVQIHYDEALRGKPFNVKTEWVLVHSSLR